MRSVDIVSCFMFLFECCALEPILPLWIYTQYGKCYVVSRFKKDLSRFIGYVFMIHSISFADPKKWWLAKLEDLFIAKVTISF